jgi:benzoate-CoA ligase
MIDIPEQFNAASYFIDKHIQEGRSEKIAIECGEVRVTYRELYEKVNRFGNALIALGIGRGERVILILPDIPEFAFSFFGAIKAGVIPVPVNTLLKPADYEYILKSSVACAVITTAELLPSIKAKYIIVVGSASSPPELSFPELLEKNSPELTSAATNKDDPAFWLYSSGSTGLPKACVHLQHDMVVCAEHYAKAILQMNESDRCFSASKLFFAYGLGNTLYYPLGVGATSIFMPDPPKPEAVFNAINQYRPTIFYSVPTNYNTLLTYASDPENIIDMSSVRIAVSAGEALPAALFTRFKDRFGIEILDSIGSTEAAQAFITNRPGAARPGSAGQIIPGYEAKILDEQGAPVKTGDVGDLFIKMDAICGYYWNEPEKTKAAINDGWLKTGDRFYEDSDGYFWFVGRSDDMLKSNGMWVSPVEVENILMEHAAVLEAAVVGKENEAGLTKPVAYISLRKEFTPSPELAAEIKKFAAGKLDAYKCPRVIEFMAELPKTATGKIQRFKLREK